MIPLPTCRCPGARTSTSLTSITVSTGYGRCYALLLQYEPHRLQRTRARRTSGSLSILRLGSVCAHVRPYRAAPLIASAITTTKNARPQPKRPQNRPSAAANNRHLCAPLSIRARGIASAHVRCHTDARLRLRAAVTTASRGAKAAVTRGRNPTPHFLHVGVGAASAA